MVQYLTNFSGPLKLAILSRRACNLLGQEISWLSKTAHVIINLISIIRRSRMKVPDYKAIQTVACTASLYGNLVLYVLTTLNILLLISASIGNTLILLALRKETSLHPPSKLLFRCLATTDLLVGVLSQPLYVIQLLSIAHQRMSLCFTVVSVNAVVGSSLIGVSLFTTATISVDRLLALLLGLRHRKTVTLKRIRGVIIVCWIISISICTLRHFWKPHHFLFSQFASGMIYSSLVISGISYTTIYLILRRHQTQMQEQANEGGTTFNITRYRKTVSTAMWVQLTLIACYFPYGVVSTISHPYALSHNLSVRLTITLLHLNSSLNPALYCWKIKGVRQAVKNTVRHLCDVVCSV